jgi:ABC-2 type transport system permease protein
MGKYWAIFKTQLRTAWRYFGDLAAPGFSILLFLWIFLQLWSTTYAAMGTQTINGLTLNDTMWYLMLAETITLSKPRLSRQITAAVKDGSVAYLLNKPYNFLLYHLSMGFGDGLMQMTFNILAGGALVWLLVSPPPDPRGWPMVLVSILFAWLIDFCINALIGLSAFITEETSAFEWIYSKLLFLLGGLLIPLDFFPPWLQSIAKVTPCLYHLRSARLFVDLPRTICRSNHRQLIWLAVLGFDCHAGIFQERRQAGYQWRLSMRSEFFLLALRGTNLLSAMEYRAAF